MGIPTISAVSPASGLSVGLTLVKITGTNFRPAPSPPPAAYTGTGAQQTVSVTFNGVEADAALVADSTEIWAVTPEYMGTESDLPDSVDIVITNLDDTGAAIGGETVTEVDGFTYKRQTLTAEGAVTWITDNLIGFFKRHVLLETVLTTDPEYADNPAGALTTLGELPAVVLVGPIVADDPTRHDDNTNELEISGESGKSAVEKPRRAKTIGFAIHGFGRTKIEATNLQESIDGAVTARQRLRMLDSRGGSDTIDLQMLLTESWESSDDTATHIHRVSNALEIRGARLRGAYGYETGPQVTTDEPVVWLGESDPFTLEISEGVE